MPHSVDGLTTVAYVWVTAAAGVLCGLPAWKQLVVMIAGALFLLLAVGSIEEWCRKAPGLEKVDPPDCRLVFGGIASASPVKDSAAQYRYDRHGSGRRFHSAVGDPLQSSAEGT